MKKIHQEISEIKSILVPEEELSDKESIELRETLKEMKAGKEKSWRKTITT
jgi:hypothetical protein